MCEQRKQQSPGLQAVPLDDLGVHAYWYDVTVDNQHVNQHICMDAGSNNVALYSFIETPVGQAKLEALARIVVSRM